MALVFCDGFDNYAATADLTKKWASVGTGWSWNSSGGRFGGGCITHAGGSSGNAIITNNVGAAGGSLVFYFGFWFKFSAIPAANTVFMNLLSAAGGIWQTVSVTTAGKISYATQFSGNYVTTSPYADGLWHWMEFNSFNGVSSCYIDSFLVQTPNQITVNQNIAAVSFLSVNGIATTYDDFVYYDGNAGALTTANFPMGMRQITSKPVASDGTCSFATLSSGTSHNALLSETNPDGDTSYVEDGTSGNQDLMGVAALGYTPLVVTAVVMNIYAKVGGTGGAINNQLICKSGATTTASASVATPANYATRQAVFDKDPNTSAAWTAAGINAAQFGYKNP